MNDLVARATQGDATALDALCRALEAPVFQLCLRMLGSRRDAEDATQEILVKAITHLSDFEGRSAFMTWVHRIGVRHVLALKASKAEERAVPIEDFGALIDQGLAFGGTPSPEDRVLAKEVRLQCTQGMLLALGRDERLALVLVEVLGLDAAEAAEVAEVSHDALRKRLSRARERLEAFLKAKCGVADPSAPCRCDRQICAKQSLGMRVVLSPLTASEDVVTASAELRSIRQVLTADGALAAPPELRARLQAALPTLLR
jgi:RNA polymerase sigma factor (sigma-70 family)